LVNFTKIPDVKIHFKGAARTVTGSKHLVELESGKRILLDCGMFQGRESLGGKENRDFGFDPTSVDMVILSHAHIDHSGLLPRLAKDGFKGPIYTTSATKSLCEIMLADSAHIQSSDFAWKQKKNIPMDEEDEPLYDAGDVAATLTLFQTFEYDKWIKIDKEVELLFTYVGHIIGSACINLKLYERGRVQRLTYTGDIGRPAHRIIRSWENFPQADYIITESTYGDRLHPDEADTKEALFQIVHQTCVENRGKLIIPAFSVGRTQEVIYALDQLESAGKLPNIKVFVDSPLSTNATEIIARYPDNYNQQILDYMKRDSNPFGFDNLLYIRDVQYSKMLNTSEEPCIIISASGMAEAGRIVHHIKNNISDERNTILLVGYCEPSSLGGRLRSGAKKVRIHGGEYKVKARVEALDSYSAHGDYEEMADFLSCQNPSLVKGIYLVHGRYESQLIYREYLQKRGFTNVEIPADDSEISLNIAADVA